MNTSHPLLAAELDRIAELNLPYDKWRDGSIAVTGGSGLVGSYLLRALRRISDRHGLHLHLIVLCRNADSARRVLSDIEDLEYRPYDARLPLNAPIAANCIVHAASNAHPLAFSADPVGTMQANLLGTMNLLENLRSCGGRLLMISTGETYGENPALSEFRETDFGKIDAMSARACYPESKRAAETLCAAYAAQYGADALCARLCYVYGPTITDRNSRADAQFLRKALSGEDIVLKSAGTQVRTYCYVADAVSALITLLLKGETAQAYNVANPQSIVSIRRYAQTLADLAQVNLRFDLPPEAERVGYSTVTRSVLNSEKLASLGWHAEYDIRTGLEHTLKICRE